MKKGIIKRGSWFNNKGDYPFRIYKINISKQQITIMNLVKKIFVLSIKDFQEMMKSEIITFVRNKQLSLYEIKQFNELNRDFE